MTIEDHFVCSASAASVNRFFIEEALPVFTTDGNYDAFLNAFVGLCRALNDPFSPRCSYLSPSERSVAGAYLILLQTQLQNGGISIPFMQTVLHDGIDHLPPLVECGDRLGEMQAFLTARQEEFYMLLDVPAHLHNIHCNVQALMCAYPELGPEWIVVRHLCDMYRFMRVSEDQALKARNSRVLNFFLADGMTAMLCHTPKVRTTDIAAQPV